MNYQNDLTIKLKFKKDEEEIELVIDHYLTDNKVSVFIAIKNKDNKRLINITEEQAFDMINDFYEKNLKVKNDTST